MGKSDTILYKRYWKIKERCYNPNHISYSRYGGRGIKMCDEWYNSYEAFESWSLENGFEPNLQIDRIDNDGDYCPENCRWITKKENCRNRDNGKEFVYHGEKYKCLSKFCEENNIDIELVNHRLNIGWTVEEAIDIPKGTHKKTWVKENEMKKKYHKVLKKGEICYAGKFYPSLRALCEELNILYKYNIIKQRIEQGMKIHEAITKRIDLFPKR